MRKKCIPLSCQLTKFVPKNLSTCMHMHTILRNNCSILVTLLSKYLCIFPLIAVGVPVNSFPQVKVSRSQSE